MSAEAVYSPAEDPALVSLLERAGIDAPDKCIGSWAYFNISYDQDHKEVFEKVHNVDANIDAIDELEAVRPGATRLLHNTYYVRHFGRYPVDLLVAQFDLHDRTDENYGMLVAGPQDWNGAFTRKRDRSLPARLAEQVQGSHALRVGEPKNGQELATLLSTMDTRFGSQQKIAFMAIQAHGSADSLQLSIGNELNSDKVDQELSTCRDVFAPRAPIALMACDTQGIGRTLSEHFRTQVIAPTSVTDTLTGMEFYTDQNGVHLIPDYCIPILDMKVAVKPALFIEGRAADPDERLAYFGPEPERYSLITGI
jgi:hypothetical protein